MATLEGKTVLVVGGSLGIGYGVAKVSLLSRAARVIIASFSQTRISTVLEKLKNDLVAAGKHVEGAFEGEVVSAKDSESIIALFRRVGEIDHLVWTSGEALRIGLLDTDLNANKDALDVRFWGAFTAAHVAKIRPGGSITLTAGSVVVKPREGWSLAACMMETVDSIIRGLTVDLAPIRVNVVSPGAVKTEFWETLPVETREKMFKQFEDTLPVRHVADAEEVAEAYLFCMKCQYLTGQRIEVDGGFRCV